MHREPVSPAATGSVETLSIVVAIRRGPRVDAVVCITERRFSRRGLAYGGRRELVAVQRRYSDRPCASG